VDHDGVKTEMRSRNDAALDEALKELDAIAPDIARVLRALPLRELSVAEAVLWWTAANGWLGNRRPWDVVGDDPAAVEAAAGHLSEPSAL
jgi:hypothetical protein